MACMCGDICCPSCGPAQGNSRCPICRAWQSDGCEHIDEKGEIKPEHKAAADQAAENEAQEWDQYAKDAAAQEDEDPNWKWAGH